MSDDDDVQSGEIVPVQSREIVPVQSREIASLREQLRDAARHREAVESMLDRERAKRHELEGMLGYRDRHVRAEAERQFRADAYALVETELLQFKPTLDVRVRSDHFSVSSVDECSAPTLREAIDELRARSKLPPVAT